MPWIEGYGVRLSDPVPVHQVAGQQVGGIDGACIADGQGCFENRAADGPPEIDNCKAPLQPPGRLFPGQVLSDSVGRGCEGLVIVHPSYGLTQRRLADLQRAVAQGVVEDHRFFGTGHRFEGRFNFRIVNGLHGLGVLKGAELLEGAAVGDQFESADIQRQSVYATGIVNRHRPRIDFAAVPRHARWRVESIVDGPDSRVTGVIQHRLHVSGGPELKVINDGVHLKPLLEGSQIELVRPGTAQLLMQMPIGFGDGIRM
jgi:hypothetical protein